MYLNDWSYGFCPFFLFLDVLALQNEAFRLAKEIDLNFESIRVNESGRESLKVYTRDDPVFGPVRKAVEFVGVKSKESFLNRKSSTFHLKKMLLLYFLSRNPSLMISCACYLFLLANCIGSDLIIFFGRSPLTTFTLKKFSFDDLICYSILFIISRFGLQFSPPKISLSLSMRYSNVLSSSNITMLSLLSKMHTFSSILMSWLVTGRLFSSIGSLLTV